MNIPVGTAPPVQTQLSHLLYSLRCLSNPKTSRMEMSLGSMLSMLIFWPSWTPRSKIASQRGLSCRLVVHTNPLSCTENRKWSRISCGADAVTRKSLFARFHLVLVTAIRQWWEALGLCIWTLPFCRCRHRASSRSMRKSALMISPGVRSMGRPDRPPSLPRSVLRAYALCALLPDASA